MADLRPTEGHSHTHGNVDVFKPAAMGKFQIVCSVLITLLVLSSVALGVLVNRLVSSLHVDKTLRKLALVIYSTKKKT